MNAMTPAELEAFRDLQALGESAAELFRIMSGKKATVVGAGQVEIEFPYTGMLKHGASDTLRLGAGYLIKNMNAFIAGVQP